MMAKKIKKIMAMVLALCICFSALPLQALAAEGDTVVEDGVTYTEGAPVNNADGTITVTVTHSGTNSEGVTVNGSETTTKDADGNVTKVEGSETKSWTEDVVLEEGFSVKEGTVDVTITDKGDGSYTFEGSASGETVKIPGKDEDNYTEITDEVVWSGSVEITGEDFTVNLPKDEEGNIVEDALYCPVAPEDYEGKGYVSGEPSYKDTSHPVCSCCGTAICGHDLDGVWRPNLDKHEEETNEKPGEGFNDGFDMVWTGVGEGTDEAAPVFVQYEYEKDENGNVKKDADGNPIVKIGEDGKPVIAYYVSPGGDKSHPAGMISQSSQFVLKHENGEYFYAYCMDANTGASPTKNRWYHITNIENAIYDAETNPDGYLNEDEAEHIKKIATYGYWGTDHNVYDENGNVVYEKDENGNDKVDADGNKTIVKDSSVRGSVASLVEMLKNSYPDGTEITVEYPGKASDATYTLSADLFDGLTEAEALAVTQAAIWTFANQNDVAGRFSVSAVLSALKLHNGSDPKMDSGDFLLKYAPEMDAECDARLQALYEVFLGLGDLSEDELKNIAGHIDLPEEKESTVIPNEGVVTGAALVIKDKIAEADENKDQNTDNDVYNTDLNFTLAFVPDPETDDMMVFLYVDGQEEPMQYRLAGGENDVVYNEDGSFTLKNIQLQEGVDHGFDLQIQGTQYLNEGVYIYQAKNSKGELGRDASQTLVGLAAGKQEFTSTTKMTINFTVDEQRNVVAQRTWIENNNVPGEEEVPPEGPNNPPEEPQLFNLNREDGVVIIDEQVPLAAAPKTGDNSFLFIALALFAAISLCAANFDKKRKHEAF